MSAQPTPALGSHADKIAEIHRLRDINAALLAAAEYASAILWGGNITIAIKRAGREKLDAAIAAAKGAPT